MDLLIIVIFDILLFFALTICRHYKDSFFLIAFSIGCACNANYFSSLSAGIEKFGLIFSIGSVLTSMFLYTIILKFFNYSIEETKGMILASIVAIIISAIIELFAKISLVGFDYFLLKTFFQYVFVAIGSLLSIFLMIVYLRNAKKRNVNKYLSLLIAIIIGNVLTSFVYYGFYALINFQRIENLFKILLGSFIIKAFSTMLGLLSFYINNRFLESRNLNDKYQVSK